MFTLIKTLPANVKPREKAQLLGLASLSDLELLAIFLRTSGVTSVSVLTLSQTLLGKFGSLRGIVNAPESALRQVRGIGKVKALELKTLAELARRFLLDEPLSVLTAQAAATLALRYMTELSREQLVIIFVSRSLQVLHVSVFYRGTTSRLVIEPQEIIALALKVDAPGFYCVHNHPSGDVTPSAADERATLRIIEAARLFNLKMHAHLVINSSGAYAVVSPSLML